MNLLLEFRISKSISYKFDLYKQNLDYGVYNYIYILWFPYIMIPLYYDRVIIISIILTARIIHIVIYVKIAIHYIIAIIIE